MQLPNALQIAIDQMIDSMNVRDLISAREELSKRYKERSSSQYMTSEAQRLSYIISRLPATYAALQSALAAIQERADFPIKSVLDLGAGPGTGMWAACQRFPEIERVTLFEKDQALADIGKRLAQSSEHQAMRTAQWQEVDLEKEVDFPPHDLIILSYSIGELSPQILESLIARCWHSTKQLLLIVEPGTPAGFKRIRTIRRQLIEKHAHLIAPCPHHEACPMSGDDWCHFAARVERSSLHRKLKGGSLGYEDEKFSYVAASKDFFPFPDARILSPPEKHTGHVKLKLCTAEGVQYPTISKKMKHLYKQARKADWGDVFSWESRDGYEGEVEVE